MSIFSSVKQKAKKKYSGVKKESGKRRKTVQKAFLIGDEPKTKAEKARARKSKKIQKRVWRKLI